jgi:propanol-preferring alcohol dehydrogenase
MKAVRMIAPNSPCNAGHPCAPFGDNDVLVRIRAAGICHSDAHYRAGQSRLSPCR